MMRQAIVLLSSSKYPSRMAAVPVFSVLLKIINEALRSYDGTFFG